VRIRIRQGIGEWLFDIALVCVIGLAIAWVVGFLQDPTPFGDDSIYYVGATKSLASNLPFLAWDPHVFSGYVPLIGFSWLTYIGPFLLVKAGFDAASSLHASFVFVFLLFGVSVFYFSKTVGSGRIVSFSAAILAWSTNTYWNITIWGGAYDRAFTLPFMFFAVAVTYRYVSLLDSGQIRRSQYWICIGAWSLTYFGDVFVAIVGTMVCAVFLLLSTGVDKITTGLRRIAVILLPPLGLSLWVIVPIGIQALNVGPYRVHYTVPNNLTSLFAPGPTWTSTLNFVYMPLLFFCCAFCLLLKARMSLSERAFLISLSLTGAYWVVMGWIPPLWPYLPRLMATDSSIENLAWVFLLALPVLIAVLTRHVVRTEESRFLRINMKLLFNLDGRRIAVVIKVLALLLVVSDALIVIPAVRPVDWGPLTNRLNSALDATVGPPSNDYRVSLQNRILTRSFYYYQPDRFDTAGRVENLDPNPFFNNWYATDVFYKNDIGSIAANYFDDRPTVDVSSLLESPYNFAGEKFWLDWHAVNFAVFYPYSYLYYTVGNYSSRSTLFSVSEQPTGYPAPEVFVKSNSPSPILAATNASTIGFYSVTGDSLNEYRSLIAILSDMGLDSRFVIPLYLKSLNEVLASPIELLVTDSDTYAQIGLEMQPLFATANIVVVSSVDGEPGLEAKTSPEGTGLLVSVPLSFSQLTEGKEPGAYYFLRSAPIVAIKSLNVSAPSYFQAHTMTLGPNSWASTYRTANAQGTLLSNSNTLIVNITNTDTTKSTEFNIDSILPRMVPLANDLTVSFTVEATTAIDLGVSFTSPASCCPNYVAIDKRVSAGETIQFEIPFSELQKWGDSKAMFGMADDLTFAVNLPSGEVNAVVRFANVSIASPAYTVSTLPNPLTVSDDGILEYDSQGATGVALLNASNDSTAVLNLPAHTSNSITTLASLSGGEPGGEYDKAITVGGNGPLVPLVAIFSEGVWSSVHEEWTNNENMVTTPIPPGFRGLIWKETYNPLWRFQPSSGPPTGSLKFYYAGPGMIYIPIADYSGNIQARFTSKSLELAILFSIPLVTVAVLIILPDRLLAFGRRKEQLHMELKSH